MEREWCVSELAGEMKMTESAISHQLRILRSARLVNGRKAGKNVFYTLADEHIRWILEKTYDHISEQ
jgi:ArsR family transcriptional regulator